jgi:hypothetical protein
MLPFGLRFSSSCTTLIGTRLQLLPYQLPQ